jgi:two-component system, cell cycle sensor histidine kinase and response regulator CckA
MEEAMGSLSESPTSPQVEPSGSSIRRILVVDDEPLAAQVAARALKAAGYRTAEVGNGRDALALLANGKERFDLVVTDVVMPETDGRTLGRLIGERHPGLPVIYVSAYPQNDVFHRGSPDPLAPFLQKPFSPEALLLIVRQLLPDASLATRQRTM